VELLVRERHQGMFWYFFLGSQRFTEPCESANRLPVARVATVPLHGNLSPEEQDRAVEPAQRQKLILATNVC